MNDFENLEQTPEVFPFAYTPVPYVKKERTNGGILFDFGRETFAKTRITGLQKKRVRVQFGESREEALDAVWSVIHFDEEPENGRFPICLMRSDIFLSVMKKQKFRQNMNICRWSTGGEFRCNEEVINKVWDVAAYTFHLNSREFFLDGIKRDGWVWSADAYQSFF